MRVGIAGAGLLGRLVASRLSLAGHAVTVFDPASGPDHRRAAGFAAAGLLSPLAELDGADASLRPLGQRSLELWPLWLAELDSPVFFARRGSLLLAHAGDAGTAQRTLDRIAAAAPDAAPQPVPPQALHAMEPDLAEGLRGWSLEGEGQLDAQAAMLALAASATRGGVRWRWDAAVAQVSEGRLDGERFDHVFDLRGVGARPALPVRGVRGEVFELNAPDVNLTRPVRLLHPRLRVYLAPRPGRRLLVGATEVESEDESEVSVRATLELLGAAFSVLPGLAEARVLRAEARLRPALPDHLPRIERGKGLTRINGLYRHGWLLAPALVEQALEGMA